MPQGEIKAIYKFMEKMIKKIFLSNSFKKERKLLFRESERKLS